MKRKKSAPAEKQARFLYGKAEKCKNFEVAVKAFTWNGAVCIIIWEKATWERHTGLSRAYPVTGGRAACRAPRTKKGRNERNEKTLVESGSFGAANSCSLSYP